VEREEAPPKLGIPTPSRSGNRFLEAEPAARNNRNQGKCLGTKLGALHTVGGNSTIKSWVGYRRKKPKGRKSSPLDDIITTSWPTQWSRQFHELLVTLTHLIQLEAEQKELLEQIIAGEQLTKDELAFHGVQWPAENKDRKPHFPGDLF